MLRPPVRLMVVLLVMSAAACGGGGDAADRDPGRGDAAWETAKEGVLRVCTEIPRPPFAFEEEGGLRGFEVELVQEIARRVGLAAEFKAMAADRLTAGVARGTCDLAASSIAIGATADGRTQFSAGYLEVRQSLLIRKSDRARYPSFAALQGATVGVCAGCKGAGHARVQASKASVAVQEFKRPDEMGEALRSGRIEAVVHDSLASAYDARTSGETHVAEVFEPSGEAYGFLLKTSAPRLLDAVNFALADLRADGTYDQLYRRYSPDVATDP